MADRPKKLEVTLVAALRHAGCVFAAEEAAILVAQAQTPEEPAGMLARRIEGWPLEDIAGWAEFYGLRIQVAPGIFVPRRRSELLVERAIAVFSAVGLFAGDVAPASVAPANVGRSAVSSAPTPKTEPHRPGVLDLCCGSGAVGVWDWLTHWSGWGVLGMQSTRGIQGVICMRRTLTL